MTCTFLEWDVVNMNNSENTPSHLKENN